MWWQELLLILEEYWDRSPDLRRVPIYQALGLARRAMSVFQTYVKLANEDILYLPADCRSAFYHSSLLTASKHGNWQ